MPSPLTLSHITTAVSGFSVMRPTSLSSPTRTPSPRRQGHERLQPLDFGVKGRAQFGRANRDRYHLDGLGQPAAGGELLVVLRFGSLDVDAQGDGRKAVGLATGRQDPFRIGQDLRWFQMSPGFMNHDLDRRILQLHQLQQSGVQRQIGKATARCGDKHATTPFWLTGRGRPGWPASAPLRHRAVAYRFAGPPGNTRGIVLGEIGYTMVV